VIKTVRGALVVDIKGEINNVELKALGREDKDKQYND
jgi:hypothetical protein